MKDFQIQAIGLISGTSLDGQMNAMEFIAFHSAYGKYLGERVNEFMQEFGLHPDIIASHGHTIFHEPQKKIMFQIGDGAAIAAETHVPTVSDFRRLDIMLGGQGAPLVPIGDRLLFADYDYCLNIGGFSNISFEQDSRRIAFDISPVNYVINHYCRQIGLEFDRDGEIARRGSICQELLDEHAAYQISRIITAYPHANGSGKLLITGGGAFNKFLIERIGALCPCEIVIPDQQIIEYKEALIFAFLGALYMADEPGCLGSVTGASMDNIGGMLFKIQTT